MNYNKSLFAGVPKKHANKSRFNLSHEYKAQIIPGRLIPILTLELMPMDEIDVDTEFMFRFAPLNYPIMHKFTMRADYFYIPNRILWQEGSGANVGWKKWIAENEDIVHPTVSPYMPYENGTANMNVMAFMGIPLIDSTSVDVEIQITDLNAFPLSAYLKIWDEYYRNPQLEGERWFNLVAGDNQTAFQGAFQGAGGDEDWLGLNNQFYCIGSKWEKDYFTSALPTPQIGEAIKVPLLTSEDPAATQIKLVSTGLPNTGLDTLQSNNGSLNAGVEGEVYIDPTNNASTIKQLRLAETLQAFYERIMKIGTRYRDFIEGMFGDDPEPMAVDVPVLIGSKFGRVQISDVMTQAYTNTTSDGDRKTGDYTGQANLYSNDGGALSYYCREHGWLMCILQVNPNTSYGQGIERFWRRAVQTDYPLDMFSNIGDQEILKEEVLYNPISTFFDKNRQTFGYIPRHSEMRYKNNMHIGEMNYDNHFGLSMHAGRYWTVDAFGEPEYDNEIEINSSFVTTSNQAWPTSKGGDIRISSIFRALPGATSSNPAEAVIFMHLYHSIWVERALPLYATPKL